MLTNASSGLVRTEELVITNQAAMSANVLAAMTARIVKTVGIFSTQ